MAAKKQVNKTDVPAALCYVPVVGWLLAIVFLIIEKSQTVKWNAIQALLVSGISFVLMILLGVTFKVVILLVTVILQLAVAVKSYQGETVKLPLVGDWADSLVKKV